MSFFEGCPPGWAPPDTAHGSAAWVRTIPTFEQLGGTDIVPALEAAGYELCVDYYYMDVESFDDTEELKKLPTAVRRRFLSAVEAWLKPSFGKEKKPLVACS